MPSYTLVIYHANCYDGFTSAWVAHKACPSARFCGATHGEQPPDVKGERVLIVDFSYPREILLRMHAEAEHLHVLDHHKTAQQDLEGLPFCEFDMERSGAGMAWDHFHPGEPRRPLVDFVEDRDLWRFRFEGTRVVHAFMSSYPMEFSTWDQIDATICDSPTDENWHDWSHPNSPRAPFYVREGKAILGYHRLTCEKMAARTCTGTLHEMPVFVGNVPVEFVSETAEILYQREPARAVLLWSWDANTQVVYCSLRSRGDGPDVSRLARNLGGGGHAHAAGFSLFLLDLMHLLGQGDWDREQ